MPRPYHEATPRAQVFANAGAKVLICSRNLAEGEATAKELVANTGAEVSAFQADVAKLDDMTALANAAVERYGGLDVLCANAGRCGAKRPAAFHWRICFCVRESCPWCI